MLRTRIKFAMDTASPQMCEGRPQWSVSDPWPKPAPVLRRTVTARSPTYRRTAVAYCPHADGRTTAGMLLFHNAPPFVYSQTAMPFELTPWCCVNSWAKQSATYNYCRYDGKLQPNPPSRTQWHFVTHKPLLPVVTFKTCFVVTIYGFISLHPAHKMNA